MRAASGSAFAAAVIGVVFVGLSAVLRPTPLLVCNASASVSVGFYRVVSGMPKLGDFILVHTPDSVAMLAAERGYLPVGVPLIKHVAAVSGDDVCALNFVISINGKPVAHQLTTDHADRPLPRWNGCLKLHQNEYFLLTEAADFFDSRYFGPVTGANIIGRLVPLWVE